MYIQDNHGKLINLSEFESIEIESKVKGSLNSDFNEHRIVGKRTFDRDQRFRSVEVTLGLYFFKRHAESVYEDLMKSMTLESPPYKMPDPGALVEQEVTDGTYEATQKYEQQWEENERKEIASSNWGLVGCTIILGVLLAIVGIVCQIAVEL